jgi:hypothetical protein
MVHVGAAVKHVHVAALTPQGSYYEASCQSIDPLRKEVVAPVGAAAKHR